MKRCFSILLSMLLLLSLVLPVSADSYNDDRFDWGEYACTHSVIKSVDAVASTCITPGHDAYTRCVACAMLLSGSDAELPLGDHTYDNTCDVDCNLCGENREVSHNVVAVEAVAPTCFENGNIDYWYCADCGQAWLDEACTLNTNLKAVVLPTVVAHDIVYTPAIEAGCHFSGNSEYWICSLCSNVWTDETLTQETTLDGVILPAVGSEKLQHVAAKGETCYEPGNIEHWYCPDCDQYWKDAELTKPTTAKKVLVPIVHKLVHVAAKDATCFENGNIEYWYCADCGQAWLDALCHLNTNLKAVILPMAEHAWNDATCDTAKTCSACGAIEGDALGHIAGPAADCENDQTCTVCGVILNPALGHTWVDASCYEPKHCSTCGKTEGDVAHGDIIHVEAVAPTCTAMGNIEYWYCEDCGFAWLDEACTLNTNLKAVILPMAEHTWNDATCDTAKTCSACGAIEGEALGHTPGASADCENPQICTVCGEVLNVALGHTWVDASCYEPKHCSTCGKTEGDVAHGDIIHVEAVAPTCTAMGNIEYWYCADCGQAWLDALCHLNTNLKAVILPTMGEHIYDDDRDADCNLCGAVREPLSVSGDLNRDGEINNRDLVLLQQYLNNWDVEVDSQASDVTGDGDINNRDLVLLQQYLNGWDVTLK